MMACDVPAFVGTTWGDSGQYALILKRKLRICKGRLDEVIHWRRNLPAAVNGVVIGSR
jgi:hypothetical protein